MPAHVPRPRAGWPADGDARWGLLGGCPTPGSPLDLEEAAEDLSVRAEGAEAVYGRWQELGLDLGSSGWDGRTAEAFLARWGELGPVLVQAREGLGDAGRALQAWSALLRSLKLQATARLEEAEEARGRLLAAQERLAELAQATADEDPDPGLGEAMAQAQQDIAQAEADLARARAGASRLAEEHEDGAGAATRSLVEHTRAGRAFADDLFTATLEGVDAELAAVLPPPEDLLTGFPDRTPVTDGVTGPWLAGGQLVAAALAAIGEVAELRPDATVPPRLPEVWLDLLPAPWGDGTGGPATWGGNPAHDGVPAVDIAALEELTGQLPTVPEIPVTIGADLGRVPRTPLPVITIPAPLRYLDWFEAVTGAPAATESWEALEVLDIAHLVVPDAGGRLPDTALGTIPPIGGTPVAAPLDPAASR